MGTCPSGSYSLRFQASGTASCGTTGISHIARDKECKCMVNAKDLHVIVDCLVLVGMVITPEVPGVNCTCLTYSDMYIYIYLFLFMYYMIYGPCDSHQPWNKLVPSFSLLNEQTN